MKRLLRSLLVLVLFSAVASAQLRYEIGAGLAGFSVSSFPQGHQDFYSFGLSEEACRGAHVHSESRDEAECGLPRLPVKQR